MPHKQHFHLSLSNTWNGSIFSASTDRSLALRFALLTLPLRRSPHSSEQYNLFLFPYSATNNFLQFLHDLVVIIFFCESILSCLKFSNFLLHSSEHIVLSDLLATNPIAHCLHILKYTFVYGLGLSYSLPFLTYLLVAPLLNAHSREQYLFLSAALGL